MKKIMLLSTALLTIHTMQPAAAPKMPVPFAPKFAPAPIAKAPMPVPIAPKAAATPAAKTLTTLVIPSANQIRIHNTSAMPAPLTGVAVTYSTKIDNAPSSTTYHGTININPPHIIKAHQALSFRPEITLESPHATISGQFETVTQIMINSQILPLPKPIADDTPIYITNTNGTWKVTAKPAPKTTTVSTATPKAVTPVAPKTSSMQAAAVPYLKTTHPQLPVMPKAPTLNAPKMPMPPTPVAAKSTMPSAVPPIPVAPKMPVMQNVSMAAKASAKAINQTMAKTIA